MVITGLSGSGKSTALKALEDLSFYAIDNLPVELLPAFVNLPLKFVGKGFKAALGMDVRAHGFVESFPAIFRRLAAEGFWLDCLFLEASDEVLIRRFSSTRRQHPLAGSALAVAEGIQRERELLAPVKEMAHQVVDTSRLTVHELREEVRRLYAHLARPGGLQVNLISFGYKYGPPAEADLLFDVRFLANP